MNTTYEATSPITGKTFARKSSRNEYKFAVIIQLTEDKQGAAFHVDFAKAQADCMFQRSLGRSAQIVEAVAR